MDEERHPYTLFGAPSPTDNCADTKRHCELIIVISKVMFHLRVVQLLQVICGLRYRTPHFPFLLEANLARDSARSSGCSWKSFRGTRHGNFPNLTKTELVFLVECIHRRLRTSMFGRLWNGSPTDGVFQRILFLLIHRRSSEMDRPRALPSARSIKQICGFPQHSR